MTARRPQDDKVTTVDGVQVSTPAGADMPLIDEEVHPPPSLPACAFELTALLFPEPAEGRRGGQRGRERVRVQGRGREGWW